MLSGGEATAMQRRCSRKSAITSGCARWSRRISMGALNESKLFKRKYRPVSAPEVDRQLRVASLCQAGAVHRTPAGGWGLPEDSDASKLRARLRLGRQARASKTKSAESKSLSARISIAERRYERLQICSATTGQGPGIHRHRCHHARPGHRGKLGHLRADQRPRLAANGAPSPTGSGQSLHLPAERESR